jgi:hypothetical protein
MTNSFAAYRGARRFTDNGRVRIEAATGNRDTRENPKKACQPFKYSINEICGDKQVIPAVQNIFKKSEKKACQHFRYSINGNLWRQTGRPSRSKYFQKSEKKACQPFKYSIIPTKT